MAKLTQGELDQALRDLPGWSVKNGMIVRTYRHDSFPEAIVFVSAVAQLAEQMNHHPDVDIRYSDVTLALVTHDQGGITRKDVSLAARIEGIRKKAEAHA
ncbi:MAG: 4a-hydroxytetrahydrobiopterin dehydratase [Candidatus Latescibacteria bacterium]|nr:4a-hydroxytetrahydrobiopterin dehydratase [Candidatus Latescibacterota bacterium]